MKSMPQLILALFAALALSNCGGPSHEKVADQMMDLMEEFADSLATIKDEASADQAAAKLEKIADKMKALGEKAKKMAEPSAEVAKRIEENMKTRQAEVQKKLMGAVSSMTSDPKIAGKISPIMERIGKIMSEK